MNACESSSAATRGAVPRAMPKPVPLLLVISSLWLSLTFTAVSHADNDPIIDSSAGRRQVVAGEYEKGLEQLLRAYQLFPLNETYRRNLAEGYALYGKHLLALRRYEPADEQLAKAVELYPEDASYALLRGICNYHLKRDVIARSELERARAKRGDSIELLYYLGLVLYDNGNRLQAIDLWQRGLKLAPGRPELVAQLSRARREMAVEEGMDRGHSSRFDLSYDPGVETAFALAILDVLESAANQVGAGLGHFPEARVPVVIYQRDGFKAVTDSPDWSGGLYDGTIRLPYGGLNEITPPMRGALYHEYAHVVVFDLTHGNCPLWLNEGIAEWFGRSQYSRPMTELNRSVHDGTVADFRKLEKGFGTLSRQDALLAYQQSYAMVDYLVTTYGWHRVKELLVALGSGMNVEAAIAAALRDYGLSYAGLVREWREYMERAVAR